MAIGNRIATLGPLVRDEDGRLFSIVAANKVAPGDDVRAEDPALVIGRTRSKPATSPRWGAASIVDTVALIEISRNTRVQANQDQQNFQAIGDPGDYLGQSVVRLGRDGSAPSSGVLSALSAPLHLANADGTHTTYYGAFEVTAGIGFAGVGDAGSPVLSQDHKLLGLLLAEADGTFYCVPAQEVLAAYGTRLADAASVALHNQNVPAVFALKPGLIVPERKLVSLFGGQEALDRTATLPSVWGAQVIQQKAALESVWHQTESNSPRVPIAKLASSIRSNPEEVMHLYASSDDLIDLRLTYVAGLTRVLKRMKIERAQMVMYLTAQSAGPGRKWDAVDVFGRDSMVLGRREIKELSLGHAVSLSTVIRTIYLMDQYAKLHDTDVPWGDSFIEPALFQAGDEMKSLYGQLSRHPKDLRAFHENYSRIAEVASPFQGLAPIRILASVANGHLVRFATAVILEVAARTFGFGALKWRAVREGERAISASPAEDHIPMS